MAEGVELTSEELADIFSATQQIRNSVRTVEFANLTLDDVRKEAINAIGDVYQPDEESSKSSSIAEPYGRLTLLSLLKTRVDKLFENIEERKKSGRESLESRSNQ